MTELQQNRYDKLMRRLGGLIGAKSMVSDALAELFPVLDVENMPGENLFLSGTKIAQAMGILNPAPGEFPLIQLFNPVDSQALITLTTAIFGTLEDDGVEWAYTPTPLATAAGNNQLRDLRTGISVIPVGQLRTNISVGAGIAGHGRVKLLGNTPYTLTDENGVCVLFPGFGITFAPETSGSQFYVTFLWRERVFEASENQFSG